MPVNAHGVIELGKGDVGFRTMSVNDGEMYGFGLITLDPPVEIGDPFPHQMTNLGAESFPVKIVFRSVKSVDVMMKNLGIIREHLLEKEMKEKVNANE